MTATGTDQAKQAVRERIWALLEHSGIVEPGVRGYIPAFTEADQAACRRAPGYGRLAEVMASFDRVCPPLLFCFPTPRREQAARRALAACHDAPALRIATTAISPEQTSPAGPVWLPLLRSGDDERRVPLSALDAALPDPWARYRAERHPERHGAAEAAGLPDDPGGSGEAEWLGEPDGLSVRDPARHCPWTHGGP